jgi:hypothetical protein
MFASSTGKLFRDERRRDVNTIRELVIVAVLAEVFLPGQNVPATAVSPGGSGAIAGNGESVPRLADGKPDFSGVWLGGGPIDDLAVGLPKGEKVPLLPSAEKIMQARQSKDDPEANCLPTGIPRVAPYPWTFATAPGRLYILFEGNIHSYRQIFMDGRPHPQDSNPTWYGHSVGRWEGDTLVVDTVGFNDKFWFDFRGHPHTEQLHTVERYTRKGFGTLVHEVTINDPGAYSKPFTVTFNARLMPEGEILEYICQENNRDVPHLIGPAGPGGGQIVPPTP